MFNLRTTSGVLLHLIVNDLKICQSRSGDDDLFKIGLRRLKQFCRTIKVERSASNYQIVTRFSKELKLKTDEDQTQQATNELLS